MTLIRRHALLLAVIAAILSGSWLRWSALGFGFHGDDHVQIGMLRGEFPAPRGPLDLFRFADVPGDGNAVIDQGYLPWWTHPNLKLAMLRPLSSALIALDSALFGEQAFYHHVHSLFWWVLLVLAGALLFRQVLPTRAAAVAVVLFAIDESNTVPVAWLANRSTLVSTAFGLLGLFIHVRFRDGGRAGHRAAEAFALLLALAGGEYAFAVLAYVFAFEVFGRSESARERARALIPALVAAGAYLLTRVVLGYGVSGSGYYLSPTDSPVAFLEAAVERVPVLVGDLIWGIPATWWVDGMPWAANFMAGRQWQELLGLAAIVAFIVASWDLERSDERLRSVRWLCAGSLLSVIPGAGALPEDRTLVAAAVGASAVLALLLARGYDAAIAALRTRSLGPAAVPLAVAAFVAFVHVGKAWSRSRDQIAYLGLTIIAQRHWALDAEIPDAGASERRVIIISGADFTTNANLPWVRLLAGRPMPRSYWRMSGAVHVHEVTRIAADTIELATLSNEIENTMVGSLYRSAKSGFRIGEIVKIDGMTVEVLASEGRHPWRMRLAFERSLDDPMYLFLHSTPKGLRRFSLPALGERIRIAAPERPRLPESAVPRR